MIKEQRIIEDILDGKRERFALLVEANNELLYRIGMSYLNNHMEVEDLMQVTYLKAYESLGKFNHQSSISTWITRIMINECLMNLRKKKTSLEVTSGDSYAFNAFEVSDGSSLESTLNNEEIKATLEKILLKLPEEYRTIFILREVQKLSTREAAEAVGISEENVNVRLYRAKKMLQKLILSNVDGSDIFSYHKRYCHILTAKVMARILSQNNL